MPYYDRYYCYLINFRSHPEIFCTIFLLYPLISQIHSLEPFVCLIETPLHNLGCERFSDYRGYADTFQWAGDHKDDTPR